MASAEDLEILKQLDQVVDCDDFVRILGFDFPVYPDNLELSKFIRFGYAKFKTYGFTDEQCQDLIYFTKLLTRSRDSSKMAAALTKADAQACKVESMLKKIKTHEEFDDLIRNMKAPSANIIDRADQFNFGIFLAVYLGNDEKIKALIAQDPSCVNKKNRYGWTPLHYVMCIGCSDSATILIEAGADPFLLNNEQVSPLVLGAKWGHRSTVNNVCMSLASLKGELHVKKLLTTMDSKQRHPLHYAAENKQHVVCNVLLAYGADPNHPDILGQTPTFLACKAGNLDTIKIVYKKWGGDIHIADKNKMTPLDVFSKDKKVLESLTLSPEEMNQ